MNFQSIVPDKSISLFVKNIWVFHNDQSSVKSNLPFFADGFPGLMFHQSENGLIVKPHFRSMPAIFLYGQTIQPIELELCGKYLIIIFQLYPFVLRTFFKINPQSINDNCYYFDENDNDFRETKHQLSLSKNLDDQIKVISNLLFLHFKKEKGKLDFEIRAAIESIINSKGQEEIASIVQKSAMGMRTFERRFKKETGLTPKQFAIIIQFQASLSQLGIKEYKKLTDIVYQNGFSDQSHFIRVFKAFTGKTPKNFSH